MPTCFTWALKTSACETKRELWLNKACTVVRMSKIVDDWLTGLIPISTSCCRLHGTMRWFKYCMISLKITLSFFLRILQRDSQIVGDIIFASRFRFHLKIRMIEIMMTRFVGQDISALQDFVILFVTQFTFIQKLQLLWIEYCMLHCKYVQNSNFDYFVIIDAYLGLRDSCPKCSSFHLRKNVCVE